MLIPIRNQEIFGLPATEHISAFLFTTSWAFIFSGMIN
jgi:hypothetical protein